MNIGCIGFLGDSFTWGEGLELYQTTPKWIERRNLSSRWQEYNHILEPEDSVFREKNRWAGIVSEYFNSHTIIDHRNGGSFSSYLDLLNPLLAGYFKYPAYGMIRKPNVLILQFSSFNRNPVHMHLKSTRYKCYCDLCFIYSDKSDEKSCKNTYIRFGDLSTAYWNPDMNSVSYVNIKNWIEKTFSIKFENYKGTEAEILYSPIHLDYLIDTYFIPLNKSGIPIFFIDSWDNLSSKIIFENKYISDRLIPLLGYDETEYLKYEIWETTFPHHRIAEEFRETNNFHPTLLQHQHIAKSVINYLEKNYNPILI